MMQKSKQVAEKKITNVKVSAIVETIKKSVIEDPVLADKLIEFLKEQGIQISDLTNAKGKDIPVSFKEKHSPNKIMRLRKAFADAQGDIF